MIFTKTAMQRQVKPHQLNSTNSTMYIPTKFLMQQNEKKGAKQRPPTSQRNIKCLKLDCVKRTALLQSINRYA